MADFKEKPTDHGVGMYIDSLLFDRNGQLFDDWIKSTLKRDNMDKLVGLACQHLPGHGLPKILHVPLAGSYNINWQLEFDDGFSTMIHIPIPQRVAFPDEKIRAEVATMRLIRENTTIPVPEIYHWGTSSENPSGYGPFIIMEYIEHSRSLEQVIRNPADRNNGLRKELPEKTLLKAYRQMADILLQLSTIEGSAIGFPAVSNVPAHKAPASSSHPRISRVHNRHISHHMNDLVTACGIPPSILPPRNKTYSTSREYYEAMADLHLARLTLQHNSAVLSTRDGREKYVARQLFRRLARDGRLAKAEDEDTVAGTAAAQQREVFKLWCDDLRPNNVLLNDNDDVVAVIDWEMSYFAPASFHCSPPWWLLIGKPEFWNEGLSSWCKEYEQRLPLFLKAMEMEETELKESREKAKHGGGASNGRLELTAIDEAPGEDTHPSTPMYIRMQRNWDNGAFFVNYIASRGDAFDPIYWKYVDKNFLGSKKKVGLSLKRGGYKGRLHLLSERERAQMKPFVAWKMEAEDSEEEPKLVEWDEKDAEVLLAACLGGTLGEIQKPKPRTIPYTPRVQESSSASPSRQ